MTASSWMLCFIVGLATAADQWVNDGPDMETKLSEADFMRGRFITRTEDPDEDTTQFDTQEMYKADKFEGDIANPGLNKDNVEAFQTTGYYPPPTAEEIKSGMANAIKSRYLMWPDGEIPYTLSSRYSSRSRAVIAAAMDEYTKRTCIRFVPRDGQRDYVAIFPDSGCYSVVGKVGRRQPLSLTGGCMDKGVVVHELMHTVGFFHEQSRPDRNSHIEIIWDNIQPGLEDQFTKYSTRKVQTLGADYDYASIMHYGSKAFTRNGRDTIRPLRSGNRIGQRRGFSDIDVYKINKLYECRGSSSGGSQTTSRPRVTSRRTNTWTRPTSRPVVTGDCRDRNSDCPFLERFFEFCSSDRRRNYMRRNCPETCGYCDSSSSGRGSGSSGSSRTCRDDSSACWLLAKLDMCSEMGGDMGCAKSCGFC